MTERDLIDEALRNHWGARCQDYEPDCPVCRAWEQYDKLLGRGVHRLKANSVESRVSR